MNVEGMCHLFEYLPQTIDHSLRRKKRKITPVAKYRREYEPVGLMLIVVSRETIH